MKLDENSIVADQTLADDLGEQKNEVDVKAVPEQETSVKDAELKQENVEDKDKVAERKQTKVGVHKTKVQEDEDLGIYEDTDDGDDLTDTELELERLREEKRKRDEQEAKEKEMKAGDIGADGRHAEGSPDKNDADRKTVEVKDQTFLTGGGMEMDEQQDKIEKVQEYLEKNVLIDPLHAQGVKRKAGFSQSAFSRPDHVTNMANQLEESM